VTCPPSFDGVRVGAGLSAQGWMLPEPGALMVWALLIEGWMSQT